MEFFEFDNSFISSEKQTTLKDGEAFSPDGKHVATCKQVQHWKDTHQDGVGILFFGYCNEMPYQTANPKIKGGATKSAPILNGIKSLGGASKNRKL